MSWYVGHCTAQPCARHGGGDLGVEGTHTVPTQDGGKGVEGYEFFSPLRQKERQSSAHEPLLHLSL